MNNNIEQSTFTLADQKELREQVAGRVEVLDKVKKLFLLPVLETITSKQIAEYYGVEDISIRQCYLRNKDEIDEDGVVLRTPTSIKADFESLPQDVTLKTVKGKFIFNLPDNITLEIPNRGVRLFSKRAVLRIGMLLRDSEIAKEVRTQLLNTFEKAPAETKVQDIETEQQAMGKMGESFANGDITAFCQACMEYVGFKNRHIEQLQTDNKMLAANILKWDSRASVNKAVRVIAGMLHTEYPFIWKQLYDELRYKHGIALSNRGKPPLLAHVHEDEWEEVQQALSAICESNNISPSKVFEKSKL